jgi:hypothetical protein
MRLSEYQGPAEGMWVTVRSDHLEDAPFDGELGQIIGASYYAVSAQVRFDDGTKRWFWRNQLDVANGICGNCERAMWAKEDYLCAKCRREE